MSDGLFEEVQHRCTGERCRACALLRGEQQEARSVSKKEWLRRAELWFDLLEQGSLFTLDDVVTALAGSASGEGKWENNAVGGFLRNLNRKGLIVRSATTGFKRKRSRNTAMTVWKKL